MSRSVLGFRLTTKFPPPAMRAKSRPKIAKAKKNPKKPGRAPTWPFSVMEVGESFFVSDVPRNHISAAACNHRDKKFATRKQTYRNTEGIRIWRVQ